MRHDDPHNLQRFVDAQADTYDTALAELRDGRKRTHWMWFIFPQFAGLGTSEISQHYAIDSRAEAAAYLVHPLLGPRLTAAAEALLAATTTSAREILGTPDDLKLRSSATLFAAVSPNGSVFHRLLEKFFDGQPDATTVTLMADNPHEPRRSRP